MPHLSFLIRVSILILVISSSALALNRIEGQVYDPNRNPVGDADVELFNEVDSFIAHTKTTSSGRFSFTVAVSGRYKIKVLALRLKLLEQTQEVEVVSSRNNNDIEYLPDFNLKYDKRSSDISPLNSPDVIFVQEIPPAAKQLYEDGADNLKKNPDKAFAKLEEALKIFPSYFSALNLLGKEYIVRSNYEKAYPYLIRAIDVNPRSFSNFFRLGYAFYQLREYRAALEATKATVILVPGSVDAQVLHGTVLRILQNYTDAEKALLKANSLAKGTNSEAHWQLALLYNKLNRNQAAIDELESYVKLVPNSPDISKIQELIAKLKNSVNKPK